ncbi:TonB-dependent receptor [Steroidobacter sp. S1-65]|uniref:TonB-dependent receptor n=1 Tax=Steroidobacter gossypii TaxID=2805490 RepID=A0ABS1WWM1_9GAMM|nr:TonB-dependent receptor [Steroidobacter gossypii]MBM0105371.1 TonB-dependent receptor [Steroidobacter gossypii]
MSHRSRIDRSVAVVTACVSVFAFGAASGQEDAGITEVVVTGSRIKQNQFDAPTPTVAVPIEAIQRSGSTNLTDFLRTMPALVSSQDDLQNTGSQGYIGSTGLNLLNLRSLGEERTLVLVDGRRHVAQLPETAAVDINTIPMDLIERVDIVTGGVSAVYGADAVSGVVNFVMKKDFEGLLGRVQYGGADAGGARDSYASITGGMNFADGRGNISGSIQHTERGRLQASDRSYLRGANYTSMKRNPNDRDDDPAVPDEVPLNDIRFFDSARAGAIDVDFDGAPDTLPDGSAFEIPTFVSPFYAQGGSGTPLADYIGDLLPDAKTTVASVFGQFELSDTVNFFGEAKFVRGKAKAYMQPTFDFSLFQSADNPYLPAAVAAQIIPGAAAEALEDDTAPDGVLVSRDHFDFGVRGEEATRDTMRFVTGVNGSFADRYNYEVSYTYGQSEIDALALNNRYNDRFLAAIDVVTDPSTGQPTCRSNLDPTALPYQPFHGFDFSGPLSFTPGANSGCRPLNIYGEGVADPAALAWIMLNNEASSRVTQNVFNAFVSGPVPGITLPAGDIDAVVGVEWRREGSRSVPPMEDQMGLTFGNVILPTDGTFNVKEAFAELRVPILADLPFAEMLQVSGAVRVSDYSTVGSTTTWNTGLLWAPVRDVSFRGTVAESVRAPNIAELFSPQSQTFEAIFDPCDVSELANGTSYRAANCAAILGALGVDPVGYIDPNSDTIPGVGTGNSGLSEETARSYTFGAVFRPQFIEGLALSIDYYDINIKQAISTADAQDVANNCVDQPTIDNVFCDSLTRASGTGAITSFVVQPENVASFRTRGIDFNLNYLLDPSRLGLDADIGTFRFALVGSRLDRLTTIPTLGAEQIDERTTADLQSGTYAPKWTTTFDTTWEFGGLTVNYGFNYFSKTSRYTLLTLAGNPDQASRANIYYDAQETHDLSASFDFLDAYRIYAGVNNLTDQHPDFTTIFPVSPVGRFYYAGLTVSFGNR